MKKENEMRTFKFQYKTNETQMNFIRGYLKNNKITDKDYLVDPDYAIDFTAGVVYLDRNLSDVGNTLSENHPELDFIILVSMPKTISFRCIKDLPVPLGIIANYFGGNGGGHPKAAGCVLPEDTAIKVLNFLGE